MSYPMLKYVFLLLFFNPHAEILHDQQYLLLYQNYIPEIHISGVPREHFKSFS